MADEGDLKDEGLIRKQEEDYTEQVDEALPKAVAQATGGDLKGAIEGLLPLEKKARIASDNKSTGRLLEGIVQMCFDQNDWDALSENVIMLTKRRGALKGAVTKMVQKACDCLEKSPSMDITLKLIDTLRTVTAGKIHVEVERARLTMKLAKIKENEGKVAEASDILQELQVETFGTMERREKVEFILEQMRLGLAKKDIIRTGILAKKVSEKFLERDEAQDLKLKFYNLQIQVALHEERYLDICKYNQAMFSTPKVQEDDSNNGWKQFLRDAIVFVVLAPYDNAQSDLAARLATEKKLENESLTLYRDLLSKFRTSEIMPWTSVEQSFGPRLKALSYFDDKTESGKKRFSDLSGQVVEHNIRVMAKYYSRISSSRLSELLELGIDETELALSKLVENKTIYAKINRPAGIITFRAKKTPADVLEDWSTSNNELMQNVSHAAHVIAKEKLAIANRS